MIAEAARRRVVDGATAIITVMIAAITTRSEQRKPAARR
jgi:hypothetical protein